MVLREIPGGGQIAAILRAAGGHQPGHVEAVGHIRLHIPAQVRRIALKVEKGRLRHHLAQQLLRDLAVSVALFLQDQLHGAGGGNSAVHAGLPAAAGRVHHGIAQQLMVAVQQQKAAPPVVPGEPVPQPVHLPAVLFHIGGGVLRPQVIGLGVAGQQRGAPARIVAGEEILRAGVLNVLRGDVVCKGLVPLGIEQGHLLFIKGREVVVAEGHLQLPRSVSRFFRHAYGVAHQVGVAVKEQQA